MKGGRHNEFGAQRNNNGSKSMNKLYSLDPIQRRLNENLKMLDILRNQQPHYKISDMTKHAK